MVKVMDKVTKSIFYGLVSLMLLANWGCTREKPTEVIVGGDATPTFRLSGSGELGTFSVYLVPAHPEKMETSIFAESPVWSIEAQPDWLHGRHVTVIGQLTYGLTPEGYTQRYQPLPLIPGRTYFFACETTDAPVARGFFRVENGKTVVAQAELPCETVQNGKSVYVPCVQKH